jgi:hypothetical protein
MRSVTGICILMGSIAGGYLPDLWGGSSWGFASLVFGAVGGVAGLFVGLRLQQ